MSVISEAREQMNKTIESMEKRFTTVRAGRANPSLVNELKVEYYGVETPIIQLATISVPEARQLNIKPFDKSCLGPIEKAVYEANLGITPTNNGEMVILTIPTLTEERRKEFVKQVKTIAEDARIALRNIRQDANKDIKNDEELTEDIEKNQMEEVQNLINEFNKKIDDLLKEKETELMSV